MSVSSWEKETGCNADLELSKEMCTDTTVQIASSAGYLDAFHHTAKCEKAFLVAARRAGSSPVAPVPCEVCAIYSVHMICHVSLPNWSKFLLQDS